MVGGVHPTTVCALVLLLAIISVQCTNAVSEWGGVNSFLLHTLSASDRAAHLSAMQANGLKVVRIFISGVDVGAKGSSSVGVSELEPVTVGVYDDTVLQQVDTLMYEAAQYGVKLLIALHDRYSLGCWHADAYVSKYGITDVSPRCDTAVNQPTAFYTNASAQADFDRRIAHILTHTNPNFSDRPWGEINEAIFGFEPENEAEGHMDNPNWSWTCHRAAKMSQYISNGILIITGGGIDFTTSLVDNHFNCSYIDVVSIHDYSTSTATFSTNLGSAKSKALSHGKRVIMEEFGSTGNDAQKEGVIGPIINAIINSGVPWLPWEFVKPGDNDNDYEFWITTNTTWNTISCYGDKSLTLSGTFPWGEISSTRGTNSSCSN